MIRIAHRHKFSPHLSACIKVSQTGAAHKDGIVDDLPIPKQFPQLLLKEITHRPTPFVRFCARWGVGFCDPSTSLDESRLTERLWPLMTRMSGVSL